jgi:hypothetical protein
MDRGGEEGSIMKETEGVDTTRKNSARKAKRGDKYEPEPRPKDLEQLIDTVNMWGFYIRCWGDRVHDELHELEMKINEMEARTRTTSHLDPPPEPYDPPPT